MLEKPHLTRHLQWSWVHCAVRHFHHKMTRDGFLPAHIIGVARGGVIPAVMLAHKFCIHDISTFGISSYAQGKTTPGELSFYGSLPVDAVDCQGQGWLIVDDLVDTGATMAYMHQLLPLAKTACLLQNKQASFFCDYHHLIKPQGTWIVFPWEGRK